MATICVMSAEFKMAFSPRWADLDPNRHLRHTAFNDYATHVRFSYLQKHGFGPEEFVTADLGPVILREETRFLAEVSMGSEIEIDFWVSAASPSWHRFGLFHHVTCGEILAATVEVDGGWMDLSRRKLRPPPDELAAVMRALPRTDDFRELPDPG